MRVAPEARQAVVVAEAAAREAGALIREAWRRGRGAVGTKSSAVDLVTETDAAAEAVFSERLRATFPDDELILEEGGRQAGRDDRRWYVDPLDGTTNFAHGFPHFAVNLAFELAGEVVAGVTYDVTRNDLYAAVRGGGATVNGAPIRVSDADALARSLLATGFPYDRQTAADNNSAEWAAFVRAARGNRRVGAAALDLAYVARGWLDGYWEMRLNPWDVAPGALLVEEAGGRVSDYHGARFDAHGETYVATNGRIHDEVIALLREVRRG